MAVVFADAIAQIQSMVKSLALIKEAPSEPPESANQFPFTIAYPGRGTFQFETYGWGTGLNEIVLEVHFARTNLPKAIRQAIPFHEQFLDLLIADPTLSGTVTTVNQVDYEFGQLEYASVQTIGWLYTLRLKQLRS